MATTEPPMQEIREWSEISRAEAVGAIDEMQEGDEFDADQFVSDFEERAEEVSSYLRYAMIDGWGFEIEIEGGAGLGTSMSTSPRGICLLSITNSTVEGAVPGPHYIAYSSMSIGFGAEASAGTGINMGAFIAKYFGERGVPLDERPITAESFAGGAVSLDVEGDVPIGNVGGGFSVFGSQEQGLFGLTNLISEEYEPGWHGISGSVTVGPGVGGGISISIGYTAAGPLEETLDAAYGREDVRNAMEEMEDVEIPEQGEFHHPHDETIVPSWLSGNIAERMQEE